LILKSKNKGKKLLKRKPLNINKKKENKKSRSNRRKLRKVSQKLKVWLEENDINGLDVKWIIFTFSIFVILLKM
jgi:hypothetical protein